jgi:hypothetical protein
VTYYTEVEVPAAGPDSGSCVAGLDEGAGSVGLNATAALPDVASTFADAGAVVEAFVVEEEGADEELTLPPAGRGDAGGVEDLAAPGAATGLIN